MSIKDRRKQLGWSRQELAARAEIDRRLVQLIELGQWQEQEAIDRVEEVLAMAEGGDLDAQLAPIVVPEGSDTLGRALAETAAATAGGPIGEA